MATAAVSYGTEIWLAELKQAGWSVDVVEHRHAGRDGSSTFGVLASDGAAIGDGEAADTGSGVFIPCRDGAEAVALLERVDDEIAGVA